MRILVLSDREDPYFWDYYKKGRLDEYDLVLSAGDLDPEYLSFIVTMGHVPVLYIHGNHDAEYTVHPPEGCDCIEDTVCIYKGIRILGLGGCAWYRNAPHHYTEKQMERRIRRIEWKLKKTGGVDIVLSHAAPKGCGDLPDFAHRGFACFCDLMDRWQPTYWVHGHVHLNYGTERIHTYASTEVVNACGRYVIEIEPNACVDKRTAKRFSLNRIWKKRTP